MLGGDGTGENWINVQHSETGLTPLAVAVVHGYREFVTRFLQTGANPLLQARNGKDCLKWAHEYNRTEVNFSCFYKNTLSVFLRSYKT